MTSQDIFAGPILRRAQQDLVTIWLATTRPLSLKFSVRINGNRDWMGHDEQPRRVRLFPKLYCYLARISPLNGQHFPTNQLLEYSIAERIFGNDDYSAFEEIVSDDSLAYGDLNLPSFFLQTPGNKLNALYGSCRKIHDKNGGTSDALSFGDSLIKENIKNFDNRPSLLCLGGDQIYADDVHDYCFGEIAKLTAKFSDGYAEKLPGGLSLPGKGKRQDFVTKNANFTSGSAQNHLITLADYAAMYGLILNDHNWSRVGTPEAQALGFRPPEISIFVLALGAVRRLLANVPTYMIFDDHDVTDDWNLSVKWTNDVKASALGKRIVANALAAYWLFQGWGNDPDIFDTVLSTLVDTIEQRENNYEALETQLWTFDKWEFFAPSYPLIYFLNTRTDRGFKDGIKAMDPNAPAYLKSVKSWMDTLARLKTLLTKQSGDYPLVLVAPGPVFGFHFLDDLQALISAIAGPYPLDFESWAANKDHLYLFLRICGDKNVVLLSGDVHYGFTSTVKFSTFDDDLLRQAIRMYPDLVLPKRGTGDTPTYKFLYASKFIQLTSSALKNFASDATRTLSGIDNGLSLLIRLNDFRPATYANGEFTVYEPGLETFVVLTEEQAKPSNLVRQRVNDALNAPYIDAHNLGFLTIDKQVITHCFYTPSGKQFERTWNFANESYWT